jgi:hypothetical protein
MSNAHNSTLIIGILVIAVLVLASGIYSPTGSGMRGSDMMGGQMSMNTMDEHRGEFLDHRDAMVDEMMEHGMYRCCLVSPCTYCIEKTPGHGEGATCDCLADIVEGEHPCGECIGEILEGHGNPYLAEYFALAIADEVGEEYVDTLREIISDKYDIALENQR